MALPFVTVDNVVNIVNQKLSDLPSSGGTQLYKHTITATDCSGDSHSLVVYSISNTAWTTDNYTTEALKMVGGYTILDYGNNTIEGIELLQIHALGVSGFDLLGSCSDVVTSI